MPSDAEIALHDLQATPLNEISRNSVGEALQVYGSAESLAEKLGTAVVREALWRAWAGGKPEIAEQTGDVLYTPRQREKLHEQAEQADARRRRIEADIAAGEDPWYAHRKHNIRDEANAWVVGFCQDESAKVRPLYGPRHFRSDRDVPGSPFSIRQARKIACMLKARFIEIESPVVTQGPYWNLLPEDLRARFEAGSILVTTKNDRYAYTDEDVAALGRSESPEPIQELVDSKMAGAEEGSYHILFYGSDPDDGAGRMGVIMRSRGGNIEPVTVTINGAEYVLEAKGCGTRAGWMAGSHDKVFQRSGHLAATGGMAAASARNEIVRLQDPDTAQKAVGCITFTNPDMRGVQSEGGDEPYDQGYVLRLTPSTVRGSFTGSEAYPDIHKPEIVDRVLRIFTSELVSEIFGPEPQIMGGSAHTENILLWGRNKAAFVDYSDHLAFNDRNYPHPNAIFGYASPKNLLKFCLDMANEIPGYERSVHHPAMVSYLQAALSRAGVNIELSPESDSEALADAVWRSGMAYQTFRAKRGSGYTPEGVIRGALHPDYLSAREEAFAAQSRETFLAEEAARRDDLKNIAGPLPGLDTWRDAEANQGLAGLLALSRLSRLPRGTSDALSKIENYYKTFDAFFVSHLRDYLDHELDVTQTALLHCPESERESIAAAAATVAARKQELQEMLKTDLPRFYELFKDESKMREFLSFDFYRG